MFGPVLQTFLAKKSLVKSLLISTLHRQGKFTSLEQCIRAPLFTTKNMLEIS
jgi:hypothetical protein